MRKFILVGGEMFMEDPVPWPQEKLQTLDKKDFRGNIIRQDAQ